jgi:hypothetical protein
MNAEKIVREIAGYCQKAGLSESTFGRLAINDGKLVSRLRDGGRITTTTQRCAAADPSPGVDGFHFFPFGGIARLGSWLDGCPPRLNCRVPWR